jgi:hypothetical protein
MPPQGINLFNVSCLMWCNKSQRCADGRIRVFVIIFTILPAVNKIKLPVKFYTFGPQDF